MTEAIGLSEELSIKDILLAPYQQVDLEELSRFWQRRRLRIECQCPDIFEDGPWFGGAIRGLLGHHLQKMSEQTKREDMLFPGRLPAFDALFKPQGSYLRGQEIPKPYIIQWQRIENRLFIWIDLFGLAQCYLQEVEAAFIKGLSHKISLRPGSRIRHPLKIISIQRGDLETIRGDIPDAHEAELRFLTPFVFKHGRTVKGKVDNVFFRLLDRIEGLALWNDFALKTPIPEFKEKSASIEINTETLTPCNWKRYSTKTTGHPIPMTGFSGSIFLRGNLKPLWRLLQLGETTHLGMAATFGLGRYELLRHA